MKKDKAKNETPPKKNTQQQAEPQKEKEDFSYPASEDIYNNASELQDLDPEDPTKRKAPNEAPEARNEKDFEEAMSGSDLDIPGAELDDAQEDIGSEDEENNYYSLGDNK